MEAALTPEHGEVLDGRPEDAVRGRDDESRDVEEHLHHQTHEVDRGVAEDLVRAGGRVRIVLADDLLDWLELHDGLKLVQELEYTT